MIKLQTKNKQTGKDRAKYIHNILANTHILHEEKKTTCTIMLNRNNYLKKDRIIIKTN